MATTILNQPISISYSQLSVFDAHLSEPYNEWLPHHSAQGFTWRPGSVSFATIVDREACSVVAEVSETAPESDSANCIIAVPFEVPDGGKIEIGSIMSGVAVTIPRGQYRLVFFDYGDAKKLRLVFVPEQQVMPEVVREFGSVRKQSKYLMSAQPG